jgi:hypothetical protein
MNLNGAKIVGALSRSQTVRRTIKAVPHFGSPQAVRGEEWAVLL